MTFRRASPWLLAWAVVLSGCTGGPSEASDDDDDDAGSGGSAANATGGSGVGGSTGGSGVGGAAVGGSATGGVTGGTSTTGGAPSSGGVGGAAATGGEGGNAGSTATGGAGGSGGSGGSAGEGGTQTYRACKQPCLSPADCTTQTSAPYDADNYECRNDVCEYIGCRSDAECETLGAGYWCYLGTGFPGCTIRCQAPSDCALGAAPYAAENYACDGGACLYTGCKSDAECQTLLASLVCRDLGTGVRYCTTTCSSLADCAADVPYADEDNVECRDNLCYSLGCNSDAECEGIGGLCR